MKIFILLFIAFLFVTSLSVNAQIVKASHNDELVAKKKGTLSTSTSSGGGANARCALFNISEESVLCIDSSISLIISDSCENCYLGSEIKWYSNDSTFYDTSIDDGTFKHDDTLKVTKPGVYYFDLSGYSANWTGHCYYAWAVTSTIPIEIPAQTIFCNGGSATLNAPDAASYQWYNNNSLIPNATSNSLFVSEPGNYFVQTTSDNCKLNSDVINITTYSLSQSIISGDSCVNGNIILNNDSSELNPETISWYRDNNLIKKIYNNGIVVAGGNGAGKNLNQLNQPYGIFLDSVKNVLVADYNNYRIIKWVPGSSSGEIITDNINNYGGHPTDILIDSHILYTSTTKNVLRFPFPYNINEPYNETIDDFLYRNAWGIAVNLNHNIYYANDAENGSSGIVYKIDSTVTGGASYEAGGYSSGANLSAINYPNGIYVDTLNNLYVNDNLSDSLNNNYGRIVKWAPNALKGDSIVGGTGYGNAPNQISFAAGLTFDKLGNMYVSDAINNRVQLWKTGADHGITIASGFTPWGIQVDDSLNLYVADQTNNAVRKFPSLLYNSIVADTPGVYKAVVTYPGGCTVTSNSFTVKECGVLATKLLNFTAHLQNKNAELSWQTASEINTSYFNIQRSTDGVNFTTVGKMYASGNSNSIHNYTYEDKNITDLKTPKLYYRISEVGKDRSSVPSNIVLINITKAGWSLAVSPNPVQNKLKLQLNNIYGVTNITLIDITGKKLLAQKINASGNDEVIFNTSALSAGIYFIEVMNNAQKAHLKFVKQ